MLPHEHNLDRPSELTRDEGYTLVEMLVVLALTSVIAAMMASAIMMIRPLKEAERRYVRQRHLQVVAETIARDLEGALPLPLKDSSADEPVSMIGGVDRVRFVGVVNTGFKREGVREISYEVEKRVGSPLTLVRETTRGENLVKEKVFLKVPLPTFSSFSLSYKSAAPNSVGQRETGVHFSRLPIHISINLSEEENIVNVLASVDGTARTWSGANDFR